MEAREASGREGGREGGAVLEQVRYLALCFSVSRHREESLGVGHNHVLHADVLGLPLGRKGGREGGWEGGWERSERGRRGREGGRGAYLELRVACVAF